ncbi:MAG: hypothetical protein ACI8X5_003679 [Planctomycetota bacterium]|jgi:hypothetical protein
MRCKVKSESFRKANSLACMLRLFGRILLTGIGLGSIALGIQQPVEESAPQGEWTMSLATRWEADLASDALVLADPQADRMQVLVAMIVSFGDDCYQSAIELSLVGIDAEGGTQVSRQASLQVEGIADGLRLRETLDCDLDGLRDFIVLPRAKNSSKCAPRSCWVVSSKSLEVLATVDLEPYNFGVSAAMLFTDSGQPVLALGSPMYPLGGEVALRAFPKGILAGELGVLKASITPVVPFSRENNCLIGGGLCLSKRVGSEVSEFNLVIGAPPFTMGGLRGGAVIAVKQLTNERAWKRAASGDDMFGAPIASVCDLNGNGWTDIAMGNFPKDFGVVEIVEGASGQSIARLGGRIDSKWFGRLLATTPEGEWLAVAGDWDSGDSYVEIYRRWEGQSEFDLFVVLELDSKINTLNIGISPTKQLVVAVTVASPHKDLVRKVGLSHRMSRKTEVMVYHMDIE